jgi:hypothetical protein
LGKGREKSSGDVITGKALTRKNIKNGLHHMSKFLLIERHSLKKTKGNPKTGDNIEKHIYLKKCLLHSHRHTQTCTPYNE